MPLRFSDSHASLKLGLERSLAAALFAARSLRELCGVHGRNAEWPCLGPDPMPHACCLLQQKNLYRSVVGI